MTIGTFAYKFSGTSGSVTELRFVPTGYTPGAGEFVGTADVLPNLNFAAIRTVTNWYWIVNDTNPTTQVFSSASRAMVANSAAAFTTWLTNNSTTANPPGVAFPIHGMANNGVGLIRLLLGTTSALQTGQRFNVGGQTGQAAASGNWIITVVDGTHVDLQGSTFNAGDPWITGGVLQGAAIIDTFANLSALLNSEAINIFAPANTGLTFTTGVATITNPIPTINTFDTTTAGAKIVLPIVTDPLSPPIGSEVVFKNIAASPSSVQVDIFANDGTSLITTAYQGDIVSLSLKNNSTANGQWTSSVSQLGNNIGQHWGLQAYQTGAGFTQVNNMALKAVVVRDAHGLTRYLDTFNSTVGASTNLDISTAGPALNGRDQAAAFAAGDQIHVYCIWGLGKTFGYQASKSLNTQGPSFPTGYTHFCYLFSMFLDGSGKVPLMGIGEYSDTPIQGSTSVPSATTCIIPAQYDHVEITGSTSITAFDLSQSYGRMVTATFVSAGGVLTNGANLLLPASANYTWAAGDSIIIQSKTFSSVNRVLAILKADGTPVVGTSGVTSLGGLTGAVGVTSGIDVTGSNIEVATDGVTAVKVAASGHGYAGGMVNGTFTVSAAAGALTIALKTQAGTDPSATDPVDFFFRNATGTTGDYTRIRVTAATSFVISSGSTMGVTSSTAFRIWIVGFNDAGTFRLGAVQLVSSRTLAAAVTLFPLVEGLNSSTAEGGAGAADSAGVIYTGTAVTSKAMLILGYAEWNSSGLTAGTWTTTNLGVVQLFGSGIRKPGDIVQSVYQNSSPNLSTTSTTFVNSTYTASITPTAAANIVRVAANAEANTSVTADYLRSNLSRGTTDNTNLIGNESTAGSGAATAFLGVQTNFAWDSPNTISSQSYAVQILSVGGAKVFYGNAKPASFEIVEYMT